MLHKRGEGGEMLMFFILFGFIVLVGGGIVGGVVLFYGGELDYRQESADILSYKIEKCLVEKDPELKAEKFFEACGLEESFFDGEDYNMKVKSTRFVSNYPLNEEITKGSNFESCDFSGARENKHFARCSQRKFENEGINYEVIIMVNNHKKQEVVG